MLKINRPSDIITKTANGAIRPYRFVAFDGSEANQFGNALGISQSAAEDGENIAVALSGILLIELAENMTAGTLASSDNEGRAKAKGMSEPSLCRTIDTGLAGELVPAILLRTE